MLWLDLDSLTWQITFSTRLISKAAGCLTSSFQKTVEATGRKRCQEPISLSVPEHKRVSNLNLSFYGIKCRTRLPLPTVCREDAPMDPRKPSRRQILACLFAWLPFAKAPAPARPPRPQP